MAAGLGFKTFTTGEVLTAADVNGYLMQGVLVFASEAARDAAITSPQEGQFAYTKDNNSLWYYTGSAWASSGATGDIEGVTAGVGISGGGTSGTVTITNSMATAIDAKGDLVAGTGADTFSRLAVGTDDQVLIADSTAATGLKWGSAPAGGMTLLASGTFASTGNTTISSISGSYKDLIVFIKNYSNVGDDLGVRVNGVSTTGSHWFIKSDGAVNYFTRLYAAQFTNNTGDIGFAKLEFPDYANTTTPKSYSMFTVYTDTGSTSCFGGTAVGGAKSTSAITSLVFFPVSGTIVSGSYEVYGVK
jgi:hypothetical protein